MKNKILYVGWVGYKNLGDDVCRDLYRVKMKAILECSGIDAEIVAMNPYKDLNETVLVKYRPNLVVLGAGSILKPPYTQLIEAAQRRKIPTIVWGSGIDQITEDELSLIQKGNCPKSFTRLQKSAASIKRAVEGASLIGLRGPHTKKVLAAIGCRPDSLQISGDPGLLLEGKYHKEFEIPLTWIKNQTKVIGVNWGSSRNNVFGQNEQETFKRLTQSLRNISPAISIFLYSVWPQDDATLTVLAKALGKRKAFICKVVYPGSALGFLLQQCLLTVNFKLHANIFSAAVGTPFISLAYRSKCFDFASSVNCDDLIIPFNHPNLSSWLPTKIEEVMAGREKYVLRIQPYKEQYCQCLNALMNSSVQLLR
ncbi:MAG TPA: polysaccharide pyruvyl transferase family protein [Bacillota bacterium]|nr:polysaccharide pyruvyl transferase family protein [Bacillota bacterium]